MATNFGEYQQGTKVRQTDDGGFILLSELWVEYDGQDALNAALIKTDSTGNVEWEQELWWC